MRFSIGMMLVFSCLSSAVARENIKLEMSPAQSVQDQQALKDIRDSGINQIVFDLSDQLFPYTNTLRIQYGGNLGPVYDPNNHTIYIPYAFYSESLNYFIKNDYQATYQKSARDAAIDTLLHTLLHEMGHAYIEDKKIPVLGREEDAVDNFATILLLNYVEEGDDIAISAADMFAYESDDKPDYYDLWEYISEHSFDFQRYFSTLCLVYGSDPEKHKHLLDQVEKDYLSDRKDFCIENYAIINENWHVYLTTDRER